MTLENGMHAELIKKERIKFVSSAVSNTVDYEHVIKKKKKKTRKYPNGKSYE